MAQVQEPIVGLSVSTKDTLHRTAGNLPLASFVGRKRELKRQTLSLREINRYEAIRLFVERATAVRQSFKLSAHNADAVTRICLQLDGLPLAIELAAARIKTMSAQQIDIRLKDRFRFL